MRAGCRRYAGGGPDRAGWAALPREPWRITRNLTGARHHGTAAAGEKAPRAFPLALEEVKDDPPDPEQDRPSDEAERENPGRGIPAPAPLCANRHRAEAVARIQRRSQFAVDHIAHPAP